MGGLFPRQVFRILDCKDGNTIQGFESEVTKARKVREEEEKKEEEKKKKKLEREAKEAERKKKAETIAAELEIKAQLLEKEKKQTQQQEKREVRFPALVPKKVKMCSCVSDQIVVNCPNQKREHKQVH